MQGSTQERQACPNESSIVSPWKQTQTTLAWRGTFSEQAQLHSCTAAQLHGLTRCPLRSALGFRIVGRHAQHQLRFGPELLDPCQVQGGENDAKPAQTHDCAGRIPLGSYRLGLLT